MAKQYKWGERYDAFRAQLNFMSLVKLSTQIGLCFGVVSIPISLIISMNREGFDISIIPIIIFGSPAVGLVNGVLHGVIGYPLYRWISELSSGHTFKGKMVGLHEQK